MHPDPFDPNGSRRQGKALPRSRKVDDPAITNMERPKKDGLPMKLFPKNFFVFAALILTAAAGTANAGAGDQGTAEQRAACTPDALRLCSSEIPDVTRIAACMRANRAKLSARCRATFESASASENGHRP
jgi:hypothetical protein